MGTLYEIDSALAEIRSELASAVKAYPAMASAHEGIAVIMEEVDELTQHVWRKPKKRNILHMRGEAVQLAAMAVRFMIDVCGRAR